MKRRSFLQHSSAAAVSLPFLVQGNKLSALSKHPLFKGMDPYSDRVLVLIQMNGGNDGLNMVLPIDQYSNLSKVRENVLIPENTALMMNNATGLHPAMSGMHQLYEEGKLQVVQNVGYPNQNRSHFRSTDIWHTASDAKEYLSTGWAGRYFDSIAVDYPEGYPNAQYPDPFAITVGSIVSETCQGFGANYSLALEDPFGLSPLLEDDDVAADPTQCWGKEIAFVRTSIAQTNAYSEVITTAAEQGANVVDYPDSRLAQQLKTISLLISGGLKTRVYVANIGGFDTHANQVNGGDTTTGKHADLLQDLSDAVLAFQADLAAQGLEKRVVGMTYSEFGRRIRSNGANGTDHGSAAPMLVFGSCINPVILGNNPVINDDVAVQEGVAMQFDFRSVYGSILRQWFGVDHEDIKAYLFSGFSEMPIIQGCDPKQALGEHGEAADLEDDFVALPNPFRGSTQISFVSRGERVYVSVMNSAGYEVKLLVDRYLSAGTYQVTFDAGSLTPGNYMVHLRTPDRQQTQMLILQR